MSGITPPRELVLASAGSGKTFRISSRLIGLLAAGAAPESILASSFTRKAAGQILARTLTRIADAVLDPNAARELSSHATLDARFPAAAGPEGWADLLERTTRAIHRVNIGTLDAFMVGAARSFEAELGLPPGWRIGTEPEMARLRSRVLSRILASADRGELSSLLRLIGRGDVARSVHDRLVGTMGEMLAIVDALDPNAPDPWRAFRNGGPAGRPTAADRERLATRIGAVPVPLTRSGTENRNWRRAIDSVVDALLAGDWDALIGTTLCQRVASGDLVYDRNEIGPELCSLLEECIAVARAALRDVLADEVEAYGELARLFSAEYRRAQYETGAFEFGDVTRMVGAGDPLGSRADLYYRLDGRTRHILLDEFQDTSVHQWEALEPLLDEILSDDGRAAVIVADPKQSIYAWRGAEPSLVHRVGARYSLGDDYLSVSWRSSQVVLDFVNDVFEGVERNPCLRDDPVAARVAASWAEDFQRHRAQKKLPGYVAIEVGPEDEGRGGDRPLLYAHAAARIAELSAAAPAFTIGVLTRTNRTVARLFLELRNLGIDVSQEGGNPLTDSASCEAILALLRLADHPGDTIAAYHVARSPLGEVVRLSDHLDRAAVRRVARTTRASLQTDGYGATITALARHVAPYCDAREARRLSQLAELAHLYDAQATLRPDDFVRLVEATRVEDPTFASVRVMTVHQAKGLEFDVAVLPELGSPIAMYGRPALVPYRADEAGRVTAVFPNARQHVRSHFSELEAAHRQRYGAMWRDALSILYVGLTRARYAVHVVAPPGSLQPGGKTVTPAAIAWAAVADGGGPVAIEPGATIHSGGDPLWYRRPEAKPESPVPSTATSVPPTPSIRVESAGRTVRRQTPSQMHAGGIDVRGILRVDTADAKERGTLIHAWFESVAWVEDGIPEEGELRRIARNVVPHMPAATIERCLAEFGGWISAGPVRAALSRTRYGRRDLAVERELPFVHRRGDLLIEGVIDRLVLERDDGRVRAAEILDFKTDRVDDDALDRRAAEYAPQLRAYARAVADMFAIPLDRCQATLVFLERGRLVTVPHEEAGPAPTLDAEPELPAP